MKKLQKKTMALLMALLLCLGAFAPAMADERTADTYYYGGTGQDTTYEVTPLPDGNLLLNGYTQLGRGGQAQLTGGGHPTRAWLLCLAPDGSILWEAIDKTEGTTRYVVPIITSAGDIAVLFYNSPSQVNTEIAIHLYSLEGQLKEKVALPLEVGLVEGVMADSFVFYDWENNYMVATLDGTVRKLDVAKEDRVVGYGVDAMVPYGDGWIIAGRTRNEDAGEAIVCFDKEGKVVWSYTTPELAQGTFVGPELLEDGRTVYNWYKLDWETGETLESRMLCLDAGGALLWEVNIPSKVCGGFAVTKDGFVFSNHWMEKTYTFIEFTLIGLDGQLQKQWQAERRREMLYGAELFTWNGEAWFHADTERQSNRVNDRQDELELQDAMLIRVTDCQPISNATE